MPSKVEIVLESLRDYCNDSNPCPSCQDDRRQAADMIEGLLAQIDELELELHGEPPQNPEWDA